MRELVVVVYDGAVLLDAAGPIEVFSYASRFGADYRLRLASPGGRPARTKTGPTLAVDLALEELTGPVDTLLVAGGTARPIDPVLVGQVRRAAALSRRLTAVCTGSFVLAEAGLLDGRRVATHWASCAELAASYPALTVDPDAIFVQDGRVTTSAGITAGMDLALSIVETDHGATLAREVAKWLVMFVQRPGGQSQFSMWTRTPATRYEPLRRALDAVALDPAADHSVAALAERASLSVRHFSRLFAREVGTGPAQYVEQVRVEAARTLLESGDQGQEAVARRCGFGCTETMRRAFLRVIGVPPGAYRDRFRSTGIDLVG
ncbi:GlxA family transcriptional regulator [Kutzneria albida]|uniref:HTH araC/xylS-type domain-containing protein n=1 Tax=Kutzneria albida DSM 43870 TaxID=1449976 RepID=W5WHY1_9PSEU|nr:DJ-1/PfpI family protein [Kutzneria albida]AHI00361.1 hypothetical protein KALB_7003 [Kutzneria albida DSM 43870]